MRQAYILRVGAMIDMSDRYKKGLPAANSGSLKDETSK
jgi:hypothetical protein